MRFEYAVSLFPRRHHSSFFNLTSPHPCAYENLRMWHMTCQPVTHPLLPLIHRMNRQFPAQMKDYWMWWCLLSGADAMHTIMARIHPAVTSFWDKITLKCAQIRITKEIRGWKMCIFMRFPLHYGVSCEIYLNALIFWIGNHVLINVSITRFFFLLSTEIRNFNYFKVDI